MPDLFGSESRAAARIHAKHHGLDVVILGEVENLGHHLLGRDAFVAGVDYVAASIEHGDFVLVGFLVRHFGRGEIYVIVDEIQIVVLLGFCDFFEMVGQLVGVEQFVDHLSLDVSLRGVED